MKNFPALDLARIPFSCAGSFLTLNRSGSTEATGLRLNTVRRAAVTPRWQPGKDWSNEITDIVLTRNGKILLPSIEVTPEKIELRSGSARAAVVFADRETLQFVAADCSVEFRWKRNLAWVLCPAHEPFFGYDPRSRYYLGLTTDLNSRVKFQPGSKNQAEDRADTLLVEGRSEYQFCLRLTVQEDRRGSPPDRFGTSVAARTDELKRWNATCPASPNHLADATRIAWYLFWNLQVSDLGGYTRQSILSSKRSMSMVWSWDNCFNALAVFRANPRLAWDQLLLVLDHQQDNGLLPDCVNDTLGEWGFNKPPVFAWTAKKLLADTPSVDRVKYATEVYPKLVRQQNWWLRERDLTKSGLLFYMNGNDSGWDNATIFDERWPVASPDLCTYLILGAEALAEMAKLLGLDDDDAQWEAQATRLMDIFRKYFVRGDEVVYHVLTPAGPQLRNTSQSLITRLPILLGHRLPPAVRHRLVAELGDEKTFLSRFGPASEALNSPRYEPNGYWRGPVWGPTSYLVFEGLLEAGQTTAAREIATRFCALCSRTAIFSENYNAVTGEDQYDSGMTWSAADFLLMARWLSENP